MNCKQCQKLISGFLDAELSAAEKESFQAHVLNCPLCAERLREMESVKQILTAAPKYPAPPHFAARVMANLEKDEERGYWFNFFLGEPAYLKIIEITVVILMVIVGAISGSMLTSERNTLRPAGITVAYSLDVFEPTPPGSVGSAYMAVMEGKS